MLFGGLTYSLPPGFSNEKAWGQNLEPAQSLTPEPFIISFETNCYG
jgi:hypothetical protein